MIRICAERVFGYLPVRTHAGVQVAESNRGLKFPVKGDDLMEAEIESSTVTYPAPWLRLLRLPNLLTVPGDAVAGFLLTVTHNGNWQPFRLLFAMAAAILLYSFGLLLNDIMDMNVDLQERPERPLPSGAVSLNSALGVAVACALTGLNLALFAGLNTLLIAATLALMIILYNGVLKKWLLPGIIAMGLCRGMSFALGVSAALPRKGFNDGWLNPSVILGFVVVFLSITALSAVARDEMRQQKRKTSLPLLPFTALMLTLPPLLIIQWNHGLLKQPMLSAALFLLIMALMHAWLLGTTLYRLQPVPITVGGHLRNHLLVQACLCALCNRPGLGVALILVLSVPLCSVLQRRLYSS
jgi:4-hydroxybenzoate polyprenyltransferase